MFKNNRDQEGRTKLERLLSLVQQKYPNLEIVIVNTPKKGNSQYLAFDNLKGKWFLFFYLLNKND